VGSQSIGAHWLYLGRGFTVGMPQSSGVTLHGISNNYNKTCLYTPNDFIRFSINSLVPREQDLVKMQWIYWSRCNCDHFCFTFSCIEIIIHQDASCYVIILNVMIQMYCVSKSKKNSKPAWTRSCHVFKSMVIAR
jgi:hypothetical protein